MKPHEKMYHLRKQKGITQAELAEILNVSRQAVSRWEMGEAFPTTENLKKLSRLYSVPLDYLLNEDEEGADESVQTVLKEKPVQAGSQTKPEEKQAPESPASGESKKKNRSKLLARLAIALIGIEFIIICVMAGSCAVRERENLPKVAEYDELPVVDPPSMSGEFDLVW